MMRSMCSTTILLLIMSLTCMAKKVDKCIACNSDSESSPNPACEKDPASQPSFPCSVEYGNDYCYVLVTVTNQNTPSQQWTWNRGCCTPKAGSNTCPVDDKHEEGVWRERCDTDNCNIMDPRTGSGGGGDDGSLTVHGNLASPLRTLSPLLLVTMMLILL